MWNSGSQQDNDFAKQVSNMSAALQLRPDCLQQFMSGNINLNEALAAMRPTPSTSSSTQGATADMPGLSQMWSNLQQVQQSMFSAQQFESSALANILSGATQGALLQQPTVTTPASTNYSESPFRSPPFTADSSSLMELSTVTPSRIKNSPSAIISKGLSSSNPRDIPSTSKAVFPLAPVSSDLFASPIDPQDAPSSSRLSEDQFKIVIGGNQTNDTPADYTIINLNDLNTDPELSNQSEAEDEAMTSDQVPAPPSDSEGDNSEAVATSQSDRDSEVFKVVKKRARTRKSTRIPKDLRGLMGEANLAYARGAHEEAIKMCLEIIRQAPYAAEPYDTLAIIYEEKGESQCALQYSLLAAHLQQTSSARWIALAGMCLNHGESEKAIDCYTKAAKASPKDAKLQLEVGKLCMNNGNHQRAVFYLKHAVAVTPPEQANEAVSIAREIARESHDAHQNRNGIEVLEKAFECHPSAVTDEDANLLCELYLIEKQRTDIFKLLARHSEMNIVFEDYDNPDYNTITKLEPPDNMAVDLLCKVAIAAIQLDKSELVEDIVKTICSHNPSDTGDIQFEVAESYINADKHAEALGILDSLVSSREYSLAAVWMKHGDCHLALSNRESAMTSYRNCVRLAPGYVRAHLLYAYTLRKSEKFQQAAQTLDSAENYEIEPTDHMKLYHERFKVCKAWAERSKKKRTIVSVAADSALQMFVNRFRSAFKEGRVYLLRRKKPSSNNPTAGDFKLVQRHAFQIPDQKALDENDLYLKTQVDIFGSKEKWIKFFDKAMAVLHKCRRYKDAIYLAKCMQYIPRYCEQNPVVKKHFERAELCSSILGKEYQRAYTMLSYWIRNDLTNNALWNCFNQLIIKTEDQRHQKFCLRLLIKNPHKVPIIVMAAHNWMASGYYKTALSEYLYAQQQVPTEPLFVLMSGIAMINLSSQKWTDFKHTFITQSLAYFKKYREMRKLDQESYYNMGRAMQQVGLEHFAIHYYELALKHDPPLVNGYETDDRLDLRREIAFNLSLIYRKSKNHFTANQILAKYCVV